MTRHERDRHLSELHSLLESDRGWTVVHSDEPAGLEAIRFCHRPGAVPDSPRVLLSAGIHGDEPAGVVAIIEHLRERAFCPEIEWLLVPIMNPSGFLHNRRTNAQGIDLNRDFKGRRSHEVRFFIDQIRRHPPLDLHLSLHEDWEYDEAYLYELNSGMRPTIAPALLRVTDECIGLVDADQIDGHSPTARGFIRHPLQPDEPDNWPEAIYLTARQPLLSYTFETPSGKPLAERVRCLRACLDEACKAIAPRCRIS